MSDQPRTPRDLQGLLKFCMEATKAEDAPASDEAAAQMDPERRAFLRRVLDEMSVDVFQELAKCIAALADESVVADAGAEDLSLQLHAFDCVEDWVGQIDMANNFHRLGGFVALKACLASPHEELVAGAGSIVAELAQNNPFCQEKLTEEGFLELLLKTSGEVGSASAKSKLLYATSCLTRGFEPARNQLKKSDDGLTSVVRLMQTGDARLRAKASFFLASLAEEDAEVAAALTRVGLPELLVAVIAEEEKEGEDQGANWREQAARALLVLSSVSPEAVASVKRMSVSVVGVLNSRLERVKGREECREEEEHCRELLKIYGVESDAGGSVDR